MCSRPSMAAATSIPRRMSAIIIRAPAIMPATGVSKSNRRPTALPQPAESYHQSWSAQSAPQPAQPDVPFNPPPVILAPQSGDCRACRTDISAAARSRDIAEPEASTTNQTNDPQERVMRQMISGLVAAVAVVAASAAPAMACGVRRSCRPAATYQPVRQLRLCRRCLQLCCGWAMRGCGRLRPMSGCPIRCINITTSIRARPIPVPATSRRIRPIRKARIRLATAIVTIGATITIAPSCDTRLSLRIMAALTLRRHI